MQRTVIVTDSTARPVPSAVAVVDLDVVVDQRASREVDIDLAELLARMSAGSKVSTSRPAPERFSCAYAQAVEDGASAVVSLHLSAALSGTVDAARLAAAGASLRVDVVDSGSVGAVLSAAVAAAAIAAAAGADATRVAAAARGVCEGSATWLSPASSAHLQRGGRAPSEQQRPALTARPILIVEQGRLVPLDRARTTNRVIARLAELTVERLIERLADDLGHAAVVVQHAGAHADARELQEAIRRRLEQTRVRGLHGVTVSTAAVSPVLAAHVGPGTIGVSVIASPDETRR